MSTGYSGTPLPKKLGIKPKMKAYLVNPPKTYLKEIATVLKEVDQIKALKGELDFIHVFTKSKIELASKIMAFKNHLKTEGLLWISWPKASSKVETDLTGDIVREIGLKYGLVDIKVCAVDEIWSGLKFVYRRKDR